jgi:hypothetical protein
VIEPVHFSRLKMMQLSPAHFRAADARREESPAMRMGTLIHALVLGGEVVVYDGKRTGAPWKAFKALVSGAPFVVYDGARKGKAWSAAKVEADGRTIVTSHDVEVAMAARDIQARRAGAGLRPAAIVTSAERERAFACADVVCRHPIAEELLDGEHEVPMSWSYLGRACAGTLDCLNAHVVEVKTSSLSEPVWFTRQAQRMGYPAQLAWYREGARQNGCRIEDCYIVAVEIKPPFAVTCMRLTDRALEQGERTMRIWMEQLLGCEAIDAWPEYAQGVVDLDVPEDVELVFDEDEAA